MQVKAKEGVENSELNIGFSLGMVEVRLFWDNDCKNRAAGYGV